MSVSYAPTKLRLPLGFEHLLEALAREILREQPKDIIQFAAEYFRRKLILRDEGALDNAEKSNGVVNEQAQAKPSESQQVTGPTAEWVEGSGPEVNAVAMTIPARTSADTEKIESAKIQEGSEQEVVNGSETKCLDVTPDVVADIDVDDPELNKAASVIQASFRTYLSKKANEEGQADAQMEPLEASGDAEPQETTELSSEGEKEVAVPQTEACENEPESEDSVDPEMTITHSASQGDVIHEDKEGTKSQSLPDKEQQVEETGEEESSKATEPQSPTQQQVDETEEDGPKENDTQPPTQDEEQQVEQTEEEGPEEKQPQPSTHEELQPLPEESEKEDGNGELASTLQSQDMAGNEIPEGAVVEDKTVPTGGVEEGAAENIDVPNEANDPAGEPGETTN